jgi:hypothetical protein
MHRAIVRAVTALFGLCAIAWAIDTIPVFRSSASSIALAQRILSGEGFTAAQLDVIRAGLPATAAKNPLPLAQTSNVTVRLMLLEDRLKAQPCAAHQGEIDNLRQNVRDTLASAPSSSFMWLTSFWLDWRCGQIGPYDLDALRMSYSTGPNEGWIAVRRSPLALGMLDKLPSDLAGLSLDEFVRLLRSGFSAYAADILAGPAWAFRDQLLKQLDKVDEADRNAFARAVDAKDLPGVDIPLPEKRPNRTF